MLLKNKKFLMLASAAIIALPVTIVHATTTNMDATAIFQTAITLTPTAMNFGGISYTTAVAGDTASIGTDSSMGYAGTWSAGGGTPAAGRVQVTAGTDGATVEVSCDTTATMTDGVQSVDVVSLEVVSETTGTGAFGTGSACAGVGTPSTTMLLDVSGGTADMFYFGGQIDGATASVGFAGGSFSTANAGGNDIQVDVVYQ